MPSVVRDKKRKWVEFHMPWTFNVDALINAIRREFGDSIWAKTSCYGSDTGTILVLARRCDHEAIAKRVEIYMLQKMLGVT